MNRDVRRYFIRPRWDSLLVLFLLNDKVLHATNHLYHIDLNTLPNGLVADDRYTNDRDELTQFVTRVRKFLRWILLYSKIYITSLYWLQEFEYSCIIISCIDYTFKNISQFKKAFLKRIFFLKEEYSMLHGFSYARVSWWSHVFLSPKESHHKLKFTKTDTPNPYFMNLMDMHKDTSRDKIGLTKSLCFKR